MSEARTVANGACFCCGKPVAWRVDRGGKAYYRCESLGSCTGLFRFGTVRESDAFLAKIGAAKSGDSPGAGDGPAGEDPPPKPKRGGGFVDQLFGGS